MEMTLFQNYPPEERKQMLEDNADEVTKGHYTRHFSDVERNQRRTRSCELDILLDDIDDELASFKEVIKARRKPLVEEKNKLKEEIKANGEYVEGTLYKIVDRDEKMVGFYDEEGNCVESRRMTPADRQVAMKFKTGTDD